MDVYFIRHFAPKDVSGICYGSTDVEADIPAAQDEHIALFLNDNVQVHSSPLMRARNYAEVLAKEVELEVQIDPRISEIDFGRWEMKLWDDIGAEDLDAWIASGYEAIHGGESLTQFDHRISAWYSTLEQDATHVVVTHAGVIRSIARTIHGLSLDDSLKLPINFGEVKCF